jgi:hypothetical protein
MSLGISPSPYSDVDCHAMIRKLPDSEECYLLGRDAVQSGKVHMNIQSPSSELKNKPNKEPARSRKQA